MQYIFTENSCMYIPVDTFNVDTPPPIRLGANFVITTIKIPLSINTTRYSLYEK
jgi:hypothetical protein